jgi:hypothetical protein
MSLPGKSPGGLLYFVGKMFDLCMLEPAVAETSNRDFDSVNIDVFFRQILVMISTLYGRD